MPGGDRTGPRGLGPRTGRGQGYCGSHDAPEFANPAFGPGLGRRRGWAGGFGWGQRFFANGPLSWNHPRYMPPTKEETVQALKSEADWLKGQLKAINQRIEEIEK